MTEEEKRVVIALKAIMRGIAVLMRVECWQMMGRPARALSETLDREANQLFEEMRNL